MKTMIMTTLAAALLSVATFATAQANYTSLSAKVMSDHPGTKGGRTINPTVRPDSDIGQQIRNFDTSAGRTVEPLAKVDNGSIHAKIRFN